MNLFIILIAALALVLLGLHLFREATAVEERKWQSEADPSDDYYDYDWRNRVVRLRIVGWICIGLSVAAAGGALIGRFA